ncbi:MAG TPA: phosphoribosylglycinamide formyltransferase [Blastocatellia bacterium]|nr:phosphoribosylglycinamide formyltransferase [Blastocatellia bacterium]
MILALIYNTASKEYVNPQSAIRNPQSKIAILISGRGSNMVALLEAISEGRLDAEAAVVISNIETAAGLEKARARGVETLVITRKGRTREEHDGEIIRELKRRDVSLVCLAGYMRLVSPEFIRAFENRILNIHPSLLPAFPGLDAQRQALEHGVKITGCTVHIVDEELDHGPIVMQRAVEVKDDDTVESLSARILEQEHEVYAEAVARVLSKGFRVEERRTFLTK